MTKEELEKRIREEYACLFDIVCKRNKRCGKYGELTICPAIPGAEYKEGGLMFVGRSINGWCPICSEKNIVDFDVFYEKQIKNCKGIGLDWATGTFHWEVCRDCPYGKKVIGENGIDATSHGRNTPFWQMVKYVCEKKGINGDAWFQKIVWSNLYKVSYVEGGNPQGLYSNQIKQCNELLKLEIELYKPKEIIFITEVYREKPSKENRTWFCETYNKNSDLNYSQVYDYLRSHHEIEVTVLMRPEFREKVTIWDAGQDLEGNKRIIKK